MKLESSIKKENLCPHVSAPDSDAWHKRRSTIRRELRRHHLTPRELALAEIILDMTLGWQRESIVIPQLQNFTDLTGILKPHVSEGISDLHAMRIIRVITMQGKPTYSIREDTDSWKVKPRVSQQTMASSINLIREWNGLAPVPAPLEAIANFKSKPSAKNKSASVTETGVTEDVPVNLPLNLY